MASALLLVAASALAMWPSCGGHAVVGGGLGGVALKAPLRPALSVRPHLLMMAASPDLSSDDDCHSILCAACARSKCERAIRHHES